MNVRRSLLWFDGFAALVAGIVTLLLHGWLSELYSLPKGVLLFIGVVNLLYASYSLPLAMRSNRPKILIFLLIAANLMWAMVCLLLLILNRETISIFGLAHLVGEGLFVGGLAYLEWRWREQLWTV